jgi:PEP-CTERM motif
MKLTKAFGPISLAFFGVALMFIPSAKAGVIFNTSLVSPGLGSPGFYNGTGNVSTNFAVDTEGNLELGLSVVTRGVAPPINPGASNVYKVLTSPVTIPPRATWNFKFSVDTQAGGGADFLGNFLYTLTITDLSSGLTGPILALSDPVRGIGDNSGFGALGKTAGVTVATQWGAQNSENIGFAGFLTGFNSTGHDLYRITLSARTQTGSPAASVSVFADATTPEPGTMVLIVTALIGIAALARRRSRRTV